MLGLDAAGKTSTSPSSGERSILLLIPMASFLSHPLQAQTQSKRDYYPYRRIQRRNRDIQECQIQRLGCGWTRQDQTALETLLYGHAGEVSIRDPSECAFPESLLMNSALFAGVAVPYRDWSLSLIRKIGIV